MILPICMSISNNILTIQQESNLYKTHYKKTFYTIYKYVKNIEIAKELTNDAFIIAFDKFDTLKDVNKFQQWINIIGMNLAKTYIEKNSKLYFVEDYNNLNTSIETFEDELIETMQQQNLKKQMKSAINRLDDDYKEVIILRYYNNLSYKEISDVMNLNMGTVKTKLHRAKEKLLINFKLKGDKNA